MGFLIFLVVILFLLAITDLIVGVSNDAVNFLNSAIGSKVARFRTIIIVASAGVILGSIFSSGIMEVARTGIFHPAYFTFEKLLWIFLAVMLTDIVLLDIFNTLGLPTSTTVSIVFELLGAALITGLIVSFDNHDPVSAIGKYINARSVITIISGIFLSIIIAFTSGILIQYLCRLLFTFNYEENLKRYGAFFAGLGITAIVYFLLIKGLKGTTLISKEINEWISGHTWIILSMLFIIGTVISGLLQRLAGINPLKVVVLMGTFSLAMAFAGNDLVNFIGVPITGFLAFENLQSSGVPADQLYQDYLSSTDLVVPNYMLLIAGVIMALTLWLSAKAKKVTETEVSLGSHSDGEEKFRPNAVARSIVKSSIMLGNVFTAIIPKSVIRNYNLSFEKSKIRQATVVHDKPAFDLVRASANLVIASSLIAFATSMKLPLSTTYVSFMVAMGTSLADNAWGRETAVYRVAGVLSVIGGWFITALIAFCVAGLFALILNKGGITGTVILLGVVAFYIIFSHLTFARKQRKEKKHAGRLTLLDEQDIDIFESNKKRVVGNLKEIFQHYNMILQGLEKDEIAVLENTYFELEELQKYGYKLRAQSIRYMKSLKTEDLKSAQILLYSSDLIQDITNSSVVLGEECLHYVKNLHRKPDKEFLRTTEELRFKMNKFYQASSNLLTNNHYDDLESIKIARDDVREYINQQLDREISIIQQQKTGTKQALLQTNVLLQSRDILAVTLRMLKMFRKYYK